MVGIDEEGWDGMAMEILWDAWVVVYSRAVVVLLAGGGSATRGRW